MVNAPTPPHQPLSPPRKSKRDIFTWRLLADVVAFATAVLSLCVAILAGTSRNEAKDEAASLSDQVAVLDAEIASLSEERDQLQDELEASPTPDAETTAAGTEEGPVLAGETQGEYVSLDQSVAWIECWNYEDWVPSTLMFAGEQYYEGFQCPMGRGWNADDPLPTSYVDFVVPDGAVKLTGLAGIDDRSVDDTMVVKFSILAVPDGGESFFSTTLALGDGGEPFEVALGEADRVRFQVDVVSSSYDDDEWFATIGWADVRFE